LFAHGFAEPAQQHRAAGQADQRVDVADLEGVAEPVGHEAAQAGRVHLQRMVGVGREQAAGEGMEARDRQSFGAREALARGGLGVVPVRPRAGIEQHAHQHQVDVRAGALPRIDPLSEQLVEVLQPVDAASFEVAPAAVVRNGVPGIALARDLGHRARRIVQRVGAADAEPLRLAPARARQQRGRALADCGRGAQHGGGTRGVAGVRCELDRRIDLARAARRQVAGAVNGQVVADVFLVAAHSLNPRPLAFLSSSASGTGPGVK
jgi:hypothetical protein